MCLICIEVETAAMPRLGTGPVHRWTRSELWSGEKQEIKWFYLDFIAKYKLC